MSGVPTPGEAEAGGHKSLGSIVEPHCKVTINEAMCSTSLQEMENCCEFKASLGYSKTKCNARHGGARL